MHRANTKTVLISKATLPGLLIILFSSLTLTSNALASYWYYDADLDGYGDSSNWVDAESSPGPNWSLLDGDCNDNNDTVYPNAPEIYDLRDNNCDGEVDEGWITWYLDNDGDGYGGNTTVVDTVCPEGYVSLHGDCYDDNVIIYPGAVEICDGWDNNCNGDIDENCVYAWYRDDDGDQRGVLANVIYNETGEQPEGYTIDFGDCDDSDPTVYNGACELCDGKDNDCNGIIDDNCGGPIWYFDYDNDGFGSLIDIFCDGDVQPDGTVDIAGDCDNNNPDVYPGAPEICDGLDNDCNGLVDDGVQIVWYQDLDYDNFGTRADTLFACEDAWPDGYAMVVGDCDDENPEINPDMIESCNGGDDNCNGLTDEAPSLDGEFVYYQDADGDGYGREEVWFCLEQDPVPEGFSNIGGDCNDLDPDINPDSEEICDHIDNNCNEEVDEGVAIIWYPDADQDGFGGNDETYFQYLCEGEDPQYPEYCCLNNLDCDDLNPNVYPGALDINDWIDNDCDGLIDEDAGTTALLSLSDVGNDQGRYLRLRWSRHLMDQPDAPETINMYSLYRRIDQWMKKEGDDPVQAVKNSPPGEWDWVATVPAVGDSIYSLVAHTLSDSTDAGIDWSVFFVRSHTSDPFVFYDSPVDSGYSIDNLFPEAPQNLMATFALDEVTLQWSATTVNDFRCYRIYRGEGEYNLDEEHLAFSTTEPAWTDPTTGSHNLTYQVTTVDFSGNESLSTIASATSGLNGSLTPQMWSLGQPVPNPFNPLTTFSFTIPGDGSKVSLRIYDLAGRVIKTLVQDYLPAGTHEAVWRGVDDDGRLAPAGIYFCRMEGKGFSSTRRMMLVK